MSLRLDDVSVTEWVRPDLPVDEFLAGCAAAGIRTVSLRRPNVSAYGVKKTRKLLDDLGIKVISYAPLGGWASGFHDATQPSSLADNIRRLDDAVELGSPFLVSAGGPLLGDVDLQVARENIAEGLIELIPYLQERGLAVAIEPLHPSFFPDGSVINSLSQAFGLIADLPRAHAGIVLDAFHTFWEGDLAGLIRQLSSWILLVHIADFIPPMREDRKSRGIPGEGCLDLVRFLLMFQAADYSGPFEIEVNNAVLFSWPFEKVLSELLGSYRELVARYEQAMASGDNEIV